MRSCFRNCSAASLLFAGVVLLSACSQPRHGGDERYYLVASNIKIPYWQAAAEGLNRAAGEMKVTAQMVGPDKYDANEQREHFRSTVAKKPAGILVSAADPELLKGDIDAAVAAGIPVVTLDSDAPGSRRLFFIGTNNYQAGLTGGRLLAQKLGGKGNVVMMTIPAQANLIERRRGYEDAFADTAIKIVQTIDVHGDPSLAFDKTKEIVTSQKLNVDAFVCLEATSGKEVADVLNRNNMQGKIVIAMDTDEQTLTWIEKGGILATLAQKPFTMAYVGLRMIDDLHHNQPQPLGGDWTKNLRALVPSAVDTGSTLIDRSNIAIARQPAQ
jgi:ribose transport system substrate-binding protein